MLSNPILSFTTDTAIILEVFGFNIMADGLRDALDSKLSGSI